MKIIFSPEYSGSVFIKPFHDNNVLMDTMVVNTIGLINLLELRLGLHYEDLPKQEREAHYYEAVCKYMAAHPDNVMEDSFKIAGFDTAKSMLVWRDELRSAEWNFDGENISDRLAILIGVEDFFRKDGGCDMAGRLHIVTDQVCFQKLNCRDMVIITIPLDLLPPTIKALINVLEKQGAKVERIASATDNKNNLSKVRKWICSKQKGKITLDKEDDSIQIWKFADDRLACEYLSYYNLNDVDLWINADNKQMDNWMKLMNKALTGSVTSDCTPQLTQLFVMGLGLFSTPLDVNTLIEWLNMPVHPLDRFFRAMLADTIVSEGGYRNEECEKKVNQFIKGDFVYLDDEQKKLSEEEQDKIRQKDWKKRENQVATFLPSFSSSDTVQTDHVRQFVAELSSWARQRAHLMAHEANNEQWAEQLMAVSGMCNAFYILLGTVKDTIDYKTIDAWMSTIYEKGTYTHAIAEQGCRIVVDSPAKIASVAQRTIWMGVDGDASQLLECAFLYPSEKKQLIVNNYLTPWKEETQNEYHEQMMLMPLLMTQQQLILVVRERTDGEVTLKHPLIVRLEQQVENLEDIVRYPHVDGAHRHKVELIEREKMAAELSISHADKIGWPDHLSPTNMDTLVEYPFDYLMENLLKITNDGKASMADVKTTKGNVAHAVIEDLFAPRNGQQYSDPNQIGNRIKNEYETVYTKALEAKGAILQLAENKLAERLLHEQLSSCLDILLEILKDNNLKVTGCESYVECQLGLDLPKTFDEDGKVKARDLYGFIDMTLEDQNGHPVVFDFKWTTWVKGYKAKLMENRSSQLEFYRMMLSREKKNEVKRVAYFLMPDALLFSQEDFEGQHCHKLIPENNNNIVQQLVQSAQYRINQIKSGIIETNGLYDELQYVKDTSTQNLFPLVQADDGTKGSNFFSDYERFIY